MLLPNTPDDSAVALAERIRMTLGETRYTSLGLPGDANITISAGVATCPHDAITVAELLDLADKALYRAKEAGRNKVCRYGIDKEPLAGGSVVRLDSCYVERELSQGGG